MWRKIADRSLKVLICFGLVMMLNLSLKPKQEAYACGPCVFLVPLVEMVVVDIAINLGFKYLAKPAWNAVKSKLAKKVIADKDNFDFTKGKVKLTKDGKLSLPSLTKNDKAKIATLLAGEGMVVVKKSKDKEKEWVDPKYIYETADVTDPFYNSSVKIRLEPWPDTRTDYFALNQKGLLFFKKMGSVKFTPTAFGIGSAVTFIDSGTNKQFPYATSAGQTKYFGTAGYNFKGGSPSSPVEHLIRVIWTGASYEIRVSDHEATQTVKPTDKSFRLYESYLHALEVARTVTYVADGLIVPETVEKVYRVPVNTPDKFILPNYDDIDRGWEFDTGVTRDKDIEVDIDDIDENIFAPVVTDVTQKLEQEMDVEVNNYDYSSKTVNYVVNNHYTSIPYQKSVEDVENEIEIYIENNPVLVIPPSGGSGGSGGNDLTPVDDPIDVPKSFFGVMYTMGQQVSDMYSGVTHFFSTSVKGMKDLTDGMTGFVQFLDEFFDWLPSEYKALLGTGFTLGVVSFFLRR